MGWNFRKSIKILPGVRINFGKGGFTSASFGPKGVKITTGKRGTFFTGSVPGTGLYYRKRIEGESLTGSQRAGINPWASLLTVILVLLLGGSFMVALAYIAGPILFDSPPPPTPVRIVRTPPSKPTLNDTVDYAPVIEQVKAALSRKKPLSEFELSNLAIALNGVPAAAPEYIESRVLFSKVDKRRMLLALKAPRDSRISHPLPESSTDDYSPTYGGGGTVSVRGYYRKNGTYVRPHTRSAPSRRR